MTTTPEAPVTPPPAPAEGPGAVAPKPIKGNSFGVAALILGIVAFVFAWIPIIHIVAIILAGVGLVLAVIGLVLKGRKKGIAIAGTAITAIALVASILMTVFYVSLGNAVADAVDEGNSPPAASAPITPDADEQPTVDDTEATDDVAEPAPAPAAPSETPAQKQALAAAQNYLDTGMGFSEAGLVKQLSSEYGSGFEAADAQWAVAHVGADWNAEAVKAAQNYIDTGMGFSRAGMIQQLTSEYGSQFTQAQAEHAVTQLGL